MTNIYKKKITLVIPTLNSEKTINKTLEKIKSNFFEIVIIDGNSNDNTLNICKKYTNDIYSTCPGRGNQLNLGSIKSKGEWLFFLHSDSILDQNCIKQIYSFTQNIKYIKKAGVFKLKINYESIFARLLERAANIRTKIFGLPYGDQGLLIKKDFYVEIGGFKNISIMEDIEIIRSIDSQNIVILDGFIKTNPEKYLKDGWIKRPIKNFICLLLFFLNSDINFIYKIYYGKEVK